MTTPLLDSVVTSDAVQEKKLAGVEEATSRFSLSWISPEMLFHVTAATTLSAVVYVSHSYYGYPLSAGTFFTVHTLFGTVLGFLLALRVVLGLLRVQAASKAVQDFNNVCRQIATLCTFVSETLTVSAGAESEAKATASFRYEAVRYLNLAYYSFQLMVNGMKLSMAPSALRPKVGGAYESQVLSSVANPTAVITQKLAKLIEAQRMACRISNEQVAVMMTKISELLDAYSGAHALVVAPTPTSLSTFAYFFTCLFAYTLGPLIAMNELGDNSEFGLTTFGLILTISYTFVLSTFYFGLFEAGKLLDAPLKTLCPLLHTDEMGYSLADDLSTLIDDEKVPVMLKRP